MLAKLLGTTDFLGLPVSFHSLSQDEEAPLPGLLIQVDRAQATSQTSGCFLKPLLKTDCPSLLSIPHWSEQAHGKAQSQGGRKESTGHCLLGSMAKRVDEWLRASTTIHHQCKLSQNKPNQQNHDTERLNSSMGEKYLSYWIKTLNLTAFWT